MPREVAAAMRAEGGKCATVGRWSQSSSGCNEYVQGVRLVDPVEQQ